MAAEIQFHNRRAVQVENEQVRVTASIEGGHLAELQHKASGVNPLWIPPWPSIEPSAHSTAKHPEYGSSGEAHLLACISGPQHLPRHLRRRQPRRDGSGHRAPWEGPVIRYDVTACSKQDLTLAGFLRLAQLRFSLRIRLQTGLPVVLLSEIIEESFREVTGPLPGRNTLRWDRHF